MFRMTDRKVYRIDLTPNNSNISGKHTRDIYRDAVFLIGLLGCVYGAKQYRIKIIGLARIDFVGLRGKNIIVDVVVYIVPFFIKPTIELLLTYTYALHKFRWMFRLRK